MPAPISIAAVKQQYVDERRLAAADKLVLKDVSRRYGTFSALEDINLTVPEGEFLVIVGPSGCGKSTLLRILAGLDKPTTGTIETARSASARPDNAMVFQGDSIFPWMTAYQNAAYGLSLAKRPKAEIDATVRPILEKIGLWESRDKYPHQLSGGMRQRVSIARAFAADPEVLLMDEPFSALDEQNKLLLQQELLRIWDETRKTVIFITHSVDEAVALSDRIMVMTASPGRSKILIDNPFPRPRELVELRKDPAYGQLVFDIWSYLRDEVQSAQEQAMRRINR